MRENFDYIFEHLIGSEGGFQKIHNDRGNWTSGRIGKGQLKGTNWGISAASYPHLDIGGLTIEEAKDIYWEDYWLPVKGSELPSGVDYAVFDIAVNHGVRDAAVFLQEAVRAIPDGVIGPRTLRRVNNMDPLDIIRDVGVYRSLDFAKSKVIGTYGKGWYRRVINVTRAADELAKNVVEQDVSSGVPWTDPKQERGFVRVQ